MSKTREQFTTPVGRIVQGDAFVAQTKDQQGNLRVVKTGPNIGQPAPQFFVALAIPKMDPRNPSQWNPEWPALMGLLYRTARAEWPTLFNEATPDQNLFGIAGKPSLNPMFTFKVKDGDGLDRNGKANADKEGFAGHWIVSFSSAYAPKVVRPVSPGTWETVTDPNMLKRGYYARIAGSTSGNDNPSNPGLYVNLDMIEIVGIGPEIVGGPDAASAFATPAQLPPGVSPVPTPQGGPMPPVPGAPAVPFAPPPVAAAPPSPAAALPAPASPAPPAVTPYTGYMDPAAAAAPPPPAPAAPGAPVMTAKAAGVPYEVFIAKGWTDTQLIQQGYMLDNVPY